MYKNQEKILLVLDLDETLLHTTSMTFEQQLIALKYQGTNVYRRPYLEHFLKEIKNYFLLAVWSSGSDDYVQLLVEKVLPKAINLEFVWGRSYCVSRSNTELYYRGYTKEALELEGGYHFIKPLKKLKKKGYSLDKTLIVDDSPYKCRDNYGNAIYVAPFTGNPEDKVLKWLATYLFSLKDSSSVRNIEKRGWSLPFEREETNF